jgi:TRAP-type C4-dicarboxylate transport system permease large subunit
MVGIVTPPIGTNLYGAKGLAMEEISINAIIKRIFVFLMLLTLNLVLVIAFPNISTFV